LQTIVARSLRKSELEEGSTMSSRAQRRRLRPASRGAKIFAGSFDSETPGDQNLAG